ncbi:hypothetical protein TNCV_1268241 [Trichonephila clavipes]|nr:hypothetical protein TNCV_1268241 [Trichonephila clavipes]
MVPPQLSLLTLNHGHLHSSPGTLSMFAASAISGKQSFFTNVFNMSCQGSVEGPATRDSNWETSVNYQAAGHEILSTLPLSTLISGRNKKFLFINSEPVLRNPQGVRVILTVHYAATRGLLVLAGSSNFELRSSDEDDTRAGTSSPIFHATPTGGRFSFDRFNVQRSPTRWVFSGTRLELKGNDA